MQATINHIMINTSLTSPHVISIYLYFSNNSAVHIFIFKGIIFIL